MNIEIIPIYKIVSLVEKLKKVHGFICTFKFIIFFSRSVINDVAEVAGLVGMYICVNFFGAP